MTFCVHCDQFCSEYWSNYSCLLCGSAAGSMDFHTCPSLCVSFRMRCVSSGSIVGFGLWLTLLICVLPSGFQRSNSVSALTWPGCIAAWLSRSKHDHGTQFLEAQLWEDMQPPWVSCPLLLVLTVSASWVSTCEKSVSELWSSLLCPVLPHRSVTHRHCPASVTKPSSPPSCAPEQVTLCLLWLWSSWCWAWGGPGSSS